MKWTQLKYKDRVNAVGIQRIWNLDLEIENNMVWFLTSKMSKQLIYPCLNYLVHSLSWRLFCIDFVVNLLICDSVILTLQKVSFSNYQLGSVQCATLQRRVAVTRSEFVVYNSMQVTVSAMMAIVVHDVMNVPSDTLDIRTVSRVLAVPSAALMKTSAFSAFVK